MKSNDFLVVTRNTILLNLLFIVAGILAALLLAILLSDDLGAARYNKQYFDLETRYDFLTNGSHGHSLQIVNGYRQCYGKEYSSDKFEQTTA